MDTHDMFPKNIFEHELTDFIANNAKQPVFDDNIITVLESRYCPSFDIQALRNNPDDVVYAARQKLLASVLSAKDTAILNAITKAIDTGKIQSAFIINAEKVQNVINKHNPMAPIIRRYGNAISYHFYCPDCGEWVYENFHPKFCGCCGKALDWSQIQKEIGYNE